VGVAGTTLGMASRLGQAGDSTGDVRYIAGWGISNKEAAYSGKEEPNVEPTYETISKERHDRVAAQLNVEQKIARRIREICADKDVELIRPTLFNRGNTDGFRPGIRIDYTHLNGVSPDRTRDDIKAEFQGWHQGKSESGRKFDVKVEVEEVTQGYTSHCDEESHYEIDQDNIEAGVAFECQANNQHNGTTGPYAYDVDDSSEVWMSVAHVCPNIGDSCYQWGNNVGTSPYFGDVDDRVSGILDQNDMATVRNDPDDADEPRRYIFGNSQCNKSDERFTESRSNTWIENNQGSTGFNQGRTTGRDDGEIEYRPNSFSLTDPQVLVKGEAADGDSGGPMYEMSYNNKYDEYQAYILGCTAYRTSNGYSLGNTFDTYNYYFDINI
jgi:hypothetical protein